MSYTVKIKSEDGKVTNVSASGTLPDGEHEVNGHDDASYISLGVTRRGADGRYVESAQHSHTKEQ